MPFLQFNKTSKFCNISYVIKNLLEVIISRKKTVGDVEVKEITPLREALPQISATAVKNVLLLAWGLTLGFPTILIPSLSGDDPDEELTLGVEAISWIGKKQTCSRE